MNATERMEIETKRDMRQRAIGYFVMRLLDDLRDEVRVYPKTPQGEMPDHDVVFNSDAAKLLQEAFQREPDMIASILPEGYAVVDKALLERVLAIAGVLPNPAAARPMIGALDAMNAKDGAEYLLRMSADRLYGLSEHARRQREEDERRR